MNTRLCVLAIGAATLTLAASANAQSVCNRAATDFNNDARVNSADQLEFIVAWGGGASKADYNADGSVNIADLASFMHDYNNGTAPLWYDLDGDGDNDYTDLTIYVGLKAAGSLRVDHNDSGNVDLTDDYIQAGC